MEMTIEFKEKEGNVYIAGLTLVELLREVYQQGRKDERAEDKSEMVTFQQLSKELAEKGRIVSVQTLTKKAREANVQVVPFDGKRLSVRRSHVKHFLSQY